MACLLRHPVRLALLIIISLLVAILGYGYYFTARYEIIKKPVYDTQPPVIPKLDQSNITGSGIQILLFTKTNSYRHLEAIPASVALFKEQAQQQGWFLFHTENGAVHNHDDLARFNLLIWSNVTGDVLTFDQRRALRGYIEKGGRFFAIHGTIGNRSYKWSWLPDKLFLARFIGHTLFPQIVKAEVINEAPKHPISQHLPKRWSFSDEWYSFEQSPRKFGAHILASLDENSYSPKLDLLMPDGDHPLIWQHNVGKGEVVVNALGHTTQAYNDEHFRQLLQSTVNWLLRHQANP